MMLAFCVYYKRELQMKNMFAIILACLSFNTFATTLTVDSGIEVLSLNGKEIKEGDSLELVAGQNQIVAEYAGRLVTKGKTEYISTVPYIMTFQTTSENDIELALKQSNFSDVEAAAESKSDIFVLNGVDEAAVKQEVLPATGNFMPYSNIPQLVANYNAENGIPFGIVEYKEKVKIESKESLNKLKYWYQQATPEERVEFKTWMADK